MQSYGEFRARCESLSKVVELADPSGTDASAKLQSENTRPRRVRRMYLAAFASLLTACAMGMALGYSSPALFDMTTRPDSTIKPTTDERSWIGSVQTLGIMLGSAYAGPMADQFGRKEALIFNIIPFTTGWLLIGCANNVAMVILGRFICGTALGLINVVVPVYCVEISTDEVRGLLGSLFMAFLCFGTLLSATVGSFLTWKYLALTGALFTVVSFLCCLPIPESPRWLISKGHLQRAIRAMDYLQQGHVNAEEECRAIAADIENEPKGRLSMKEFLHPTVYKPTIIASILYVFHQFSGMGAVFYYSSTIFESAKSFLDPKQCSIILCVVLVVSTLASNLIIDRSGRKVLLLLSAVFMALTLAAFGAYYYVALTNVDFRANYSWVPIVVLNLYVIASAAGFVTVPCVSAAELVPLRARSSAGGISLFISNLSAFIVTKTFAESNERIGIYGTFWTYAGFCVLAVFFVALVVPETKGKKLEDISKIFDRPENRDNVELIY